MTTRDNAKPQLLIDFCDFCRGINKADNHMLQFLAKRYDVLLSTHPDLVFCADYGQHHKLYSCKKVFWTSESVRPDFRLYDYAMTTFHIDDPRHIRLPYYVVAAGFDPAPLLMENRLPLGDELARREFCSFVISNANPKRTRKRLDFFKLLSTYKQVASGGTALNNIGKPIGRQPNAKIDFLKQYKFNLCFENRSFEGYITEKIWDAFKARSVPIYWGDPRVAEEFNPKSFLSLHDYPSEQAFLERIKELDNNDEAYLAMLRESPFHNDTPNK